MTDDTVAASRARMYASGNEARRALERRLHDGPQQHLVAMAVKLRLIENQVDDAPEEAKAMLAELRSEVQETVQQLRDIASAIFPPLLTDRGLAEALRAAASRQHGRQPAAVDVEATGRYPLEVEAGVYFAAVDAMHMATGPLRITLVDDGGALELRVVGPLDEDAFLHVEDHVQTVGGYATRTSDGLIAVVPA